MDSNQKQPTQYCVVSYINKKFLNELFSKNNHNAEVFDEQDIIDKPEDFPHGLYPFWYLYHMNNPNSFDREEVLTIIKTNCADATYKLLNTPEFYSDYYNWWKNHQDEPYDNCHAWTILNESGKTPLYVTFEEAQQWYDNEYENILEGTGVPPKDVYEMIQ